MKSIFYKIHSTSDGKVLAVCDKDLIDKTLAEKDFTTKISGFFYKDDEATEDEIAELIKEFRNINLIGDKAVGIAIKEGIAKEKSIIRIAGIPHLQIFKI